MKKSYFLLFPVIILILTACSTSSDSGEYTGFSDIPEHYTAWQASEDGCLVITDSVLYAGAEGWQSFLEESEAGKDAFLRIVQFIEEDVYYEDLYYEDGTYLLYADDQESGTRLEGSFTYLRALTGKLGNAQKETTLYVLTDSLELTCEDVLWTFASSNLKTVTDIPFVWLDFTTYLDKADNSL